MTGEERSFGRYRVVATLGRGAMGEVYAAVDEVLGREVAIKTLRGGGAMSSRLLDDRFRNEAKAVAALSHPGVVQVFDVDVTASPPFLVMERVAGPSLAVLLEDGALPIDDVRSLGVQIARALAAAHERGVVHRDVKPGNILAAGPGRWKLADFGVAHVPDSSLTLTGQFVGSPAYAAPEALTRGELGPAGDVFGLGAVLYQAASGRWPRSEPSSPGVAALLARPPALAELAPGVPRELAAVIERALELHAEDRPTAEELARALSGEVVAPPPPRPSEPKVATVAPIATAAPFATAVPVATIGTVVPAPIAGWRKYKVWIAVGAALVVGIAIGIANRGGRSTTTSAAPIDLEGGETLPVSTDDGSIVVRTPPGLAGKAAKDWDKLLDKLNDGELREARDKLDEFERRYGRTAETADLAAQLERLDTEPWFGPGPPGGPSGPPGHGHGKHHD